MNWTSHPEPKRKTEQYPGGHLPESKLIDHLICASSEDLFRSDGKNALKECFFAALNGMKYTNEISCLRGHLRKGIIKLAEEIHKSDNINIDPPIRRRMRKEAIDRFLLLVAEHGKIVSEAQKGQIVWRFK